MIFISVALIFTLVVSWIGLLFGSYYTYPYANYFFPGSSVMSTVALVNFYFVSAIPMAFLILFFIKTINKRSLNRGIKNKMWVFWGMNAVCLLLLSGSMFKEFNHRGQVSEIIVKDLELDNLHIKSKATEYDEILMSFGDLKVSDESLISDDIRLKISPSEGDYYAIIKNKSARGNSRKYAHKLAREIENFAVVNEDVFEFEEVIKILEGQKWRDQRVNIDIQIPQGKTIEFDNSQKRFSIQSDEGYIRGRDLKGKKFEMTKDGLKCINCPKSEKE